MNFDETPRLPQQGDHEWLAFRYVLGEMPLAEAEAKFASQGIGKDKRVVAYCGGGISATIDLFQLYRLGYDKLTLYDGSMGEWAKDASLPIETG